MTGASKLARPDLRNVPEDVWPRTEETRELMVDLDLSLGGRYVTVQCQMGVHHACPGGLRTETQMLMQEFRCRCVEPGCACRPAQEPRR